MAQGNKPVIEMASGDLVIRGGWGRVLKRILFWGGIAIAVVVASLAAIICFFFYQMKRGTDSLDAVALSASNYQPATTELIKLCQMDPAVIAKDAGIMEFDPANAPPSVSRLHPEGIRIEPNEAEVWWGGGFYHCGWSLSREPSSGSETVSTWKLEFTRENQKVQTLQTIQVPTSLAYSEDEYVRYVLAEYDRRISIQADEGMSTFEAEWYNAAARCLFAARHQRVDLLPPYIRAAAANYPHDWRDVLITYFLDRPTSAVAAAQHLRDWANQTGGPIAWTYAAYGFYAGGDVVAGDDALRHAATSGSNPNWINNEEEEFEMGMGLRLYAAARFRECAAFCNAVLAAKHQSFTNRNAVAAMAAMAGSSPTSRPAMLPAYDKFTSMDPFGGFDLSLLVSTAPTNLH